MQPDRFPEQLLASAPSVRRPALATAIALAVLGFPLAAHSESTSEALKIFGLIGTWSKDCATDPLRGDTQSPRLVFASPFFGGPTLSYVDLGRSGVVAIKYKINSASIITDEKIKIKALLEQVIGNVSPDEVRKINRVTEVCLY